MNANAPQTLRPASRHSAAWPLALLCLLVPPSFATEAVQPYELTTRSSEPAAAFEEALRSALVRASGDRAAATAPALQPLLAAPRRYVLQYRPAPGGGLRVTLDGRSLDRAIVAAGGQLWPRERAVLLVGFELPPDAGEASQWRAAIEASATARGLPVRFASAAMAPDLAPDAALAVARAAAADLLLVARAPTGTATAAAPASWRLVSRAGEETLDGDAATVVDAVADRVARAAIDFMQQPETAVLVQISGIGSLQDYATAQQLLAAVPGVRRVVVRELQAQQVRFGVLARGGAVGLVEVLAAHPRFAPAAGAAQDALAYELRPLQAP